MKIRVVWNYPGQIVNFSNKSTHNEDLQPSCLENLQCWTMENHLWTNQPIKISYHAISCCHRKILDKNCTHFHFSCQTSKVSDLQASFSAPPALDKLCTTWIESLLAQTSNSTDFILFSIRTKIQLSPSSTLSISFVSAVVHWFKWCRQLCKVYSEA